MPDTSIERFRRVVGLAYAGLEARRQEVNDLNVFPVADGDTGDNMALTMEAVMRELARLDGAPVDANRDDLVHAVARAALMGARGNSGVILSQIVRGAAEELASRPGELVDPVLVAAAFARAADAAYESVRDPAEGTMLTVIREMAHAVSQHLAHMNRQRLEADASDTEQDRLLAEVLEVAVRAGKKAVERTPEQLEVLADAGVVDAGAHGLVVILAGVVAGLRDQSPATPELPRHEPPRQTRPHHYDSRFRYCTNFIVTGTGLNPRSFVPRLEEIGDSVLVVGDEATLKVHVHTDDPEVAVVAFEEAGEVQRLDIADMREQIAARERRLTTSRTGVVAVAAGEGMKSLFEGLGAHVVDGGANMNPSTYEILAGIHEVAAEEVLVLPNSPSVVLAAQEAAKFSEKPARVVPSASPQSALAALVELDPAKDAGANAERLRAALAEIRSGAVAPAARDDPQGRFVRGDAVGFAGEGVVAWGGAGSTLSATIARIAAGAEIVTVIEGEGAPIPLDELPLDLSDQVELEVQRGDQPHYWWLLAAQ
ncbi:MAG TPA: DAK2 domain-containing protein [Solirubrobacterales bacterium]|jgi:DAK2 domain fusion protein YloV|nr:DAK2 domain-containing protein [Solirubrobacterales bacterium]